MGKKLSKLCWPIYNGKFEYLFELLNIQFSMLHESEVTDSENRI